MKVVDILKHKRESLTRHNFEILDKMSPALKEYWHDFISKAQAHQLFPWIKEFDSKPAVNEELPVEEVAQIEMSAQAQSVYDELQANLGEVYHVGEWLDVDQAMIDQFGVVTHDNQWIHTNPERAEQESPFKTTIAHGFLTLALLPKLTDSVNPDNPQFPTAKVVVNMGLNKVRFPYPVKSGSRVRAESSVVSVEPVKKGLEIVRQITVKIDGVRRPACIAESVIRVQF
jgi:acyl dehydratase